MAQIKSSKIKLTRKDSIIKTAAKLFKEKGFSATSMREIADKVGVEAASLYNHIKNKNEILNIICFDVANMFNQNINEIEISSLTTLEKVEKLLRFHIDGMLSYFDEVYVSDREWKHLDNPYLNNIQNQRRTYRKKFAVIIENGIKNKEFKKVDAPTVVLIMLHAISGIESWHRSKQKIDGKELAENMITILIEGLKK